MTQGHFISVTILVMLLFSTGCSTLKRLVYRIDVNQGNYLEQHNLKQLKRGMTKEQVIFLLGTPALRDPFTQDNCWHYLFRRQCAHQVATQNNLKLTFNTQGRLERIEGDFPWQKSQLKAAAAVKQPQSAIQSAH
jgi:outer membrane protein assembly factor BamE